MLCMFASFALCISSVCPTEIHQNPHAEVAWLTFFKSQLCVMFIVSGYIEQHLFTGHRFHIDSCVSSCIEKMSIILASILEAVFYSHSTEDCVGNGLCNYL